MNSQVSHNLVSSLFGIKRKKRFSVHYNIVCCSERKGRKWTWKNYVMEIFVYLQLSIYQKQQLKQL